MGKRADQPAKRGSHVRRPALSLRPHESRRVDAFWRWFVSVAGALTAEPYGPALVAELDRRIRALGVCTWELGPCVACPGRQMLVISAGGDAALVPLARAILARAPRLDGWEFLAAKPPKEWDRVFVLDVGGAETKIDAGTWHYVLEWEPDGRLSILFETGTTFDSEVTRNQAAEIVAIGELGEEVIDRDIKFIDAVDRLALDDHSRRSAIEHLRDHVANLLS